jgi:phospholipase C
MRMTRRTFLALGGGAVAAGAIGALPDLGLGIAEAADATVPTPAQAAALAVLGKPTLRLPGSLPDPTLAVGTDILPGIENIVIFMLENHSYDNFLGMLGRQPGQTPRGDGFTIGADGAPTATNPYANGSIQRAFHMPTTCQLNGQPSQEWQAGHDQYDNGALDGFVTSSSGPVAMGYWTGSDLPFTYDLCTAFPIADRWFCSLLGQTDPNRRFLIAGTSAGLTDDIPSESVLTNPPADLPSPPNGTIFQSLSANNISWTDYVYSYPTGATPELYYVDDAAIEASNEKVFADFFTDAAAGNLPRVSLLDPDFDTQSQENPQNIVVGEALLAQVVDAVGSSPQWDTTLLVVMYDEHGGYYDHVPPPVALVPDDIPPVVQTGESTYDGFGRYGFRVPAVVISPYAKRDYVSHLVYDHTSVLAMIQRKWNLPALTYRDANANDLMDFLDLGALAAATPTFPVLPPLVAAGNTPAALACSTTGPGAIPPAGSVVTSPVAALPETPWIPGLALGGIAAGAAVVAHQRHKSSLASLPAIPAEAPLSDPASTPSTP